MKPTEVNLFLAGFSHLDPLFALTETALQQQWLKMLCFGSNYPRLNLLKKPPDFWHHMGPHSTCLVLEMISSIQVYFPKKVMIERKPVSYSTRYWHSGVHFFEEFSTNDSKVLLSYGFVAFYSFFQVALLLSTGARRQRKSGGRQSKSSRGGRWTTE